MKFLKVADHKDNTLRMGILDPKIPMPKTLEDYKVEEYSFDFGQFNPLDRVDLYR